MLPIMLQLRTKVSLAICTALLAFSSCSKKFSTDTPLPNVYPPSVIIGSDNGILYGYDYTKGTQNWAASLPNSIYASPCLYHGYAYIGVVNYLAPITFGTCDTIYKINSSTGVITKKFSIGGTSFSIMATPMADANLLYVATTNDTLYAIDTGSGAVIWRCGGPNTGSFIASPTVYNGNVYFANTLGTVFSCNKTNGNLNWTYTPTNYLNMPVSFQSSPAISDPYLYIGSNTDSNLYCMRLTPLTATTTPSTSDVIKWTFKTKGAINSSPAAAMGKCVVGSNDFRVYCVDSITGLQVWSDSTASNINSSPVIYNSMVYIGSNDYNLYAINILDGSVVWHQKTNGLIKSSPMVYKGTVFVGSYDKYFYAFDALTGSLKWSTNVNGQMQCSATLEDYSGNQYNSQVSGFQND